MITLDVLSVNGNTALADATYQVNPSNVVLGYANPDDANQTIVEVVEEGDVETKKLLVDDTVANVVAALNAGKLLEIFFAVSLKARNGYTFPAAQSGFVSLDKIIYVVDESSDGTVFYNDPTMQDYCVLVTDEVISDYVSKAADISPGAETLAYPLTSKNVVAVEANVRTPKAFLINEKYVGGINESEQSWTIVVGGKHKKFVF